MGNINLYFWNNEPNLGDYLSEYIVGAIAADRVMFKNPFITGKSILKSAVKGMIKPDGTFRKYTEEYLLPGRRILFAIGSILDWAPENAIVWGSGFREPDSTTACRDIRAVRGYLTRDLLPPPLRNVPVGDPALLLPLILPPSSVETAKDHDISIIPHFKDKRDFSRYGDLHFIDIQNCDIRHFVNELTSSRLILSSSLHGIILAHSYGIPALWIKNRHTGSSDFKVHDYYSSLGIEAPIPLSNTDLSHNRNKLEEILANRMDKALPSDERLKKLRDGLLSAFPYPLKPGFRQDRMCHPAGGES